MASDLDSNNGNGYPRLRFGLVHDNGNVYPRLRFGLVYDNGNSNGSKDTTRPEGRTLNKDTTASHG